MDGLIPFYYLLTLSYIPQPSYLRREPEDTKSQDAERDIFNEKPSKEDIISATEASGCCSLVVYAYAVKLLCNEIYLATNIDICVLHRGIC
jgi:hypothetical protein